MTETTEQIKTEDLVLLAGVMGWRPETIRTADGGDVVLFCDDLTGRYYCVEDWKETTLFAPHKDTAEAVKLAEAWCLETDGGWSFNWTARGRHVVYLYDVNEPDPIITKRAPTLPLAITRAVLAAIRADDKPRPMVIIREFLNIPQPTRDGILKGLGIKVGVAPVDYSAAMVELREAGKMDKFKRAVLAAVKAETHG